MKNPKHYGPLLVTLLLLVGACKPQQSRDAGTTAPGAADAVPSEWLGRWTGPEGTLLDLSKSGEIYTVKISSLDGPAVFEGKGVGGHIEFQRDDKIETIRATGGKETGMKWLADKSNCLTIRQGEGYCRG